MLPSLLLSMLAALPVMLLPSGIGAATNSSSLLHYANKVLWLSALLLLCSVPFLSGGDGQSMEKLLPSLIFVTALYLLYIKEKEENVDAESDQESIHTAFIELANRMDGEDSRLCANLHDELNPCLIFAKRKIEESLSTAKGEADISIPLNRAMQEIDRAYSISRGIIKKVHVEIVESIGLTTALDDLISHYNEISPLRTRLEHTLSRKTEQGIERSRAIIIYRIIREGMLNAIKHSRARNLLISIEVLSSTKTLHLKIQDDGIGIPDRHLPGVGLIDMRIRAIQAGGTLSIGKGDDHCGTVIDAHIPIT